MKYTKQQKENLKEYNKLNEWFKNHCAKTGKNPVADYKYKNKYEYKKPTEAGIEITK
jgi:hypothetical protein